MTHKITYVLVKNYKSCIETELKLASYTPLVGYNNAGKTNALSAIQWLLRKSSLTAKDFYDPSLPVEISALIEGVTTNLLDPLPQRQQASLKNYVFNDTLKIRRTQEVP